MSSLRLLKLCKPSANYPLLNSYKSPIQYNSCRLCHSESILKPDPREQLADFDSDLKKHLKNRKKKSGVVSKYLEKTMKVGIPLVICKDPKLNHYRNMVYDKFKHIPLASENWKSHKHIGDFFKIKIHTEDYEIENRQEDVPFSDAGISPEVVEVLKSKGLVHMSEIQRLAIPRILSGGNNLIGAETGSGKTLAYLLPAIEQIFRLKEKIEPKFNSPYILILIPSRELSSQVCDVAKWFKPIGIKSRSLVGGHVRKKILNPSFDEIHVLVSTLGVIEKLTHEKIYSLANVRHIILDEADTLLDDSFSDALNKFLGRLQVRSQPGEDENEGVQLTMACATLPTSVDEKLSGTVDIELMNTILTDKIHKLMPHITHKFMRTGRAAKPAVFLHEIRRLQKKKAPTIIFCNKADTALWVSSFLEDNDIPNIHLSGEVPLRERKGRFESFQGGEVNFMVCTSFASRGLDTCRAEYVINYEFPSFIVEYIHRCGRTGRLGSKKPGTVINLISGRNEIKLVNEIETAVRTMSPFQNVNPNVKRVITYRGADAFEKNFGVLS